MANETEKKGFAYLIGYIKNALSLKADKTEIPSLTGCATQTWVQQQGYLTQHQDISGKADVVPRIAKTAQDTTATIDPNKLYVFPEMASLTITLAAITDNTIVNEYHFIFESGATATTTTFPAIPGLDDFAAEANTAYEVSVLEGLALITPHTLDAEEETT